MEQNNKHKEKLKSLFNEVLLNYEVHKKWLAEVDDDFLDCAEILIKKYNQSLPREEWMRLGIVLGAVYEQWRQKHGTDSINPVTG